MIIRYVYAHVRRADRALNYIPKDELSEDEALFLSEFPFVWLSTRSDEGMLTEWTKPFHLHNMYDSIARQLHMRRAAAVLLFALAHQQPHYF